MKILGIIPARGGSQRIPKKNIRKFLNKPLLLWSIDSALKSDLDKVIVSTDDPNIAKIAQKNGAEVPFLRPKELGNSKIGIEPVLKHAYEWLLINKKYKADAIALLMPTNPVRSSEDINQAIKIFKKSKPDSVVSVVRATANNNPHWILKRNLRNEVSLFTGRSLKNIQTRSQDLPDCYSRNDIIYVLKPDNLYEKKPNLYGNRIELLVMNDLSNVDINTEEDWFVAEQKLKFRLKSERNSK